MMNAIQHFKKAELDKRLLKILKKPSMNLNCSGSAVGSGLQAILETKKNSRGP
jgi:hypothetical protein